MVTHQREKYKFFDKHLGKKEKICYNKQEMNKKYHLGGYQNVE